MDIELHINASELREAVLAWATAKGAKFPSDTKVIIVAKPEPLPSVPSKVLQPVHKITGQMINGVKYTHYGYPGDATPDSNSMAGIGDRGNKLYPTISAALTKSYRNKLFGITHPSTGKMVSVSLGSEIFAFEDADTAPEPDERVDIYDPFYTGRDPGNTDEMYAKSKAEMIKAGILTS